MSNLKQGLEDTNELFKKVLDDEFNKHQAVFTQCLLEVLEKEKINKDLNTEIIGSFLIYSWHVSYLRLKTSRTANPLDDFRTFVFQQLLN